MRQAFLLLLAVHLFLGAWAQQTVFSTPFDLMRGEKDNSSVLKDPASGEHLVFATSGSNLHVWHFSPDWKVLDQFVTPIPKESFLSDLWNRYDMPVVRNGSTWAFITQKDRDFKLESIDLTSRKLSVRQGLMPDKPSNYGARLLSRPDGEYLLYMGAKLRDGLMLQRVDREMQVSATAMKLNTDMPRREKKKLDAETIFLNLAAMQPNETDLRFNKNAVQLYNRPEGFVITIASAAEAEAMTYDPITGSLVNKQYFSVADQLPAGAKPEKAATVMLMAGNHVFVLAATRDGGAVGSFNALTGERIAALRFDPNGASLPLAFPPSAYETSLQVGTGRLMEQVVPVDLKTFCADLVKLQCSMLYKPLDASRHVLVFGGWDLKTGPSGQTDRNWLQHTTVGILVDPTTGAFAEGSLTWAQAHGRRQEPSAPSPVEELPSRPFFSYASPVLPMPGAGPRPVNSTIIKEGKLLVRDY